MYNATALWRQKKCNQQKAKLTLSDNREKEDQVSGYVQHNNSMGSEEEHQQVAQLGATAENRSVQIDDTTIPMKSAHMMWFSGLRGAVSYGLVKTFPETGNENVFVITTMFIALITTFVFGGGTDAALKAFKIDTGVEEKEYLKQIENRPILTGWLRRFEEVMVRPWILKKPQHTKIDPDTAQTGNEKRSALLPEPQQSIDLRHNDADVEGAAGHFESGDSELTDNEVPHASIFDYGH